MSESHYGRRDRSVPRSAGNVIYVSRVRVRPRPLVFLERVAHLEGKLADAPATGKPSTRSPVAPIVPTVPTAEAGNVEKLSSAGARAVVRVVDACREVLRDVSAADLTEPNVRRAQDKARTAL